MDQPEGVNDKDVLDVRKVIEKSTSKVSLRDLEKKGFRQVKVLRAGDINQLIYKAVQTVLAKNPVGGAVNEAERQRILNEAKTEYENQLKAAQTAQQEAQKANDALEKLESEKQQIEEAKKRLEEKVGQINAQFANTQRAFGEEKKKLEAEKQQLEREKQQLYEKGLDTVSSASKQYQSQIEELRAKLAAAEQRESKDTGAYRELETRARAKVEELERKVRSVEHELELTKDGEAREKGRATELDGEAQRLRTRARELEGEAGKAAVLRARVADLEKQLEREREAAARQQSAHEGEVQRLRGDHRAELERAVSEAAAAAATQQAAQQKESEDVELLRQELALANQKVSESNARMGEMFGVIMAKLQEVPKDPGPNVDIEKQLKSFSQSLTDQMRKIAGSAGKGGWADASEVNISGLAMIDDNVKLETNIKEIAVRETSAKGVKDKLSKLKNMRGGGGPK